METMLGAPVWAQPIEETPYATMIQHSHTREEFFTRVLQPTN